MLLENLEAKWIDCFCESFELSGISPGEIIAILSESQSRQVLVDLSEQALLRIGAKPVHIRVPSPKLKDPVPVRSTGSCYAMHGYDAILPTLGACDLIIDCTVEGMLHSKELQAILQSGGRIYMISNEHPEVLETFVFQSGIDDRIGTDLSLGVEYRPLHNNNLIIVGGVSGLIPGEGLRDIYSQLNGDTDRLFAAFLEMIVEF